MFTKELIILSILVASSLSAIIVPAYIEISDEGEIADITLAELEEEDHHDRVRRQIKFDHPVGPGTAFGKVDFPSSGGVLGTGGYTAPIFNNNNGRLQGTAQGSKLFGVPGGPTNIGGQLDYTARRGSANLGVDHMMHGPTSVGVGGSASVWRPNKNTDLSLQGSYNRQFGPGAYPKPNYNVGATFRHNF